MAIVVNSRRDSIFCSFVFRYSPKSELFMSYVERDCVCDCKFRNEKKETKNLLPIMLCGTHIICLLLSAFPTFFASSEIESYLCSLENISTCVCTLARPFFEHLMHNEQLNVAPCRQGYATQEHANERTNHWKWNLFSSSSARECVCACMWCAYSDSDSTYISFSCTARHEKNEISSNLLFLGRLGIMARNRFLCHLR